MEYNPFLLGKLIFLDYVSDNKNESDRNPIYVPATKTACKHRRISDYIPDRNSGIISKPPCPKHNSSRVFGVLKSVRSLE